jgi:cytochrome P450
MTFVYDPYAPEVMADPLPFYKVLRDSYPAYWIPEYGAWAISRFEDVWQVLSDREGRITTTEGTLMFREQLCTPNHGVVPEPSYDPLVQLSYTESPVHEQLRQAVGAPLRRPAVARLEEFVRSLARARLDELVPLGTFDITTDYAGMVAAATMCHLFGVPLDHAAWMRDLVFGAAPGVQDPDLNARGFKSLSDAVGSVVRDRRAAGADGSVPLVDGLLQYRLAGRALSDEEATGAVLVTVLFGGIETLPKIVGHGMMELWHHPDQRRAVAASPDGPATAFEEMLRYCAPAQWFSRTVRRPIVIAGQELGVGHRVFPLLMSANRDEREFESPDEFRWDRRIERHLAFGQGQNFCIGNHVARLEGRVLVEELLARVPEYGIDTDGARRPPSSFQWGWRVVPLVVPGPPGGKERRQS